MRKCGGYCDSNDGKRQHPKKKGPAVRRPALLLPKHNSNLQLLESSSLCSPFRDEQEMLCFHHYCNSTSKHLAGPFESSLWTQLIPQACQGNSSIRHAVVSIAALSLIPGIGYSFADQQAESYHRFALQQYSKALQEMRNDTVSGSQDIRSALIACLVVICFEAFYGNHESALNQLGAGLGLINTWSKNRNVVVLDSTKSVSTPSEIIEKELIQAYARLDVQVLMLDRSRGMGNRITMTQAVLPRTHMMPQGLLSIE